MYINTKTPGYLRNMTHNAQALYMSPGDVWIKPVERKLVERQKTSSAGAVLILYI